MSDDMKYTASQLARVLNYHGDLPVVVSVVDPADRQEPSISSLRVVLSTDNNGSRVVELLAFEE